MGTEQVQNVFFPEETLNIVREASMMLSAENLQLSSSFPTRPHTRTDGTFVGSLDSVLFGVSATHQAVYKACKETVRYGCATLCLPPSMMEYAKYTFEGTQPALHLTATIGFPYGDDTTAGKTAQMRDVADCADEYEAMVNLAAVKDRDWRYLLDELVDLRRTADGKDFTAIIDGSVLDTYEKTVTAMLALRAGCSYLKYYATVETNQESIVNDVALFRMLADRTAGVRTHTCVKTCDDVLKLLAAGADRVGTVNIPAVAAAAGFIPQNINYVSQ